MDFRASEASVAQSPALRRAVPQTPLRRFLAACIVAAGFCVLGGIYLVTLTPHNAVERDYIEFWVIGRQLIHHANPYDGPAVLQIEQGLGLDRTIPRISFSPPVNLTFTLALGLMSARNGLVVWLMGQMAALGLSFWLLWRLHGRPDSRLHLLGFVFGPCLACLLAGQLSNYFLLCMVLFLTLQQRRPFLAGAVLMPFAMKPHLILPFALTLIAWTVVRRAWRLAAGFVVALAASSAVPMAIDPQIWAQYRQMMAETGVLNVWVPSLSSAMRFAIAPHAVWLEFVPEGCACVWAMWYFWRRRERWEWGSDGLMVLLVGAVCAPYGWFYDEAILFPAVLAGMYAAQSRSQSLIPIAVCGAACLVELLSGLKLNVAYYLWTTPAWLAWYVYATRSRRCEAESPVSLASV